MAAPRRGGSQKPGIIYPSDSPRRIFYFKYSNNFRTGHIRSAFLLPHRRHKKTALCAAQPGSKHSPNILFIWFLKMIIINGML